jgi:butyryl-CoA dehydrogenase
MILTQEQEMIRDSLRAFAQERLAPFAAEWDRQHTFPADALRELGELGALGMVVPEQWGGAGMDYMSLVLVIEEIAAGDGATSTIVSVQNSLACGITMKYGSDEQKETWLKPLARGEMLGCFCLTEPHTGSDAAAISTRADRDGDFFVLERRQAVHHHRQVRPGGDRLRGHRQGCRQEGDLLLPGADLDAGLHRRPNRGENGPARLGHRADPLRGLPHSGFLPARHGRRRLPHRPVEPRSGPHRHRCPVGRHGACRLRSRRAIRQGSRNLRQADHRASGGQLPSRRHGDADRRRPPAGLASGATYKDAGKPCLKEASMAKMFASEMAEKVCSDAIQILGGYGYVSDFPVERIYRDVRVCQIYEGANDIQRLVIGRAVASD